MQPFFFIRMGGKHIRIDFSKIIYVEGRKNYMQIVTEKKNYLVLITMQRLEELLPAYLFQRIHKSFIVSLDRVVEFDSDSVYLINKQLPLGQQYKNELHKSVVIVNDVAELLSPTLSFSAIPMVINANRRKKFLKQDSFS